MAMRTHILHLCNWLRAIYFWLADARLALFAIGIVIASLAVVFHKGVTEPEVRLTGLVLQILGIATVAWGIRETRVLFGRPDIFSLVHKWVKSAPPYRGRVVSGSVNGTLPALQGHVRGDTMSAASLNPTIEERVAVLERNIQNVNNRISAALTEIDQNSRAQASALEEERQQRSQQDQTLGTKLEATETGGLHISAMGALWLFIGVTLSTASAELSIWLK